MNVLALTVRQHQIGPFPLGDFPAIVKIERGGRVFRHQANRLRQREAIAFVVRDAEGRVQQAGGVIVR